LNDNIAAPQVSADLQKSLESELFPIGWKAAKEKVAEVDPEFCLKVNDNDWYRLIRALGIYKLTGKPYSSFKRKASTVLTHHQRRNF
jgi:tRNA dimethylallyltransferase